MNKAILSLVALQMLAYSAGVQAADLLVPSQYSTIQGAVDAAANGDRVLIAPGTYSGFSVTNMELIVEGESAVDLPHLEAASGVVMITDATVTLRNLSLEFDAAFAAVYATGSGVRIDNCELWHYGYLVYGSDEGWNGGMYFENCSTVHVTDCRSHGRDGEGEPFPGAGPGYGAWGIQASDCTYIRLENCEFEGGDGGGVAPVQGGTGGTGTGGDGGSLSNCEQVVIIGCTFTGGDGDPAGEGLKLENGTTAYWDTGSSASSTSVDGTSSLQVLIESGVSNIWQCYR